MKNLAVSGISQLKIANGCASNGKGGGEPGGKRRRELSVARGSRRHNRMIEATARETKAGRNIVWLEIRQFFEHLLSR
jgi:hypothetical protein